MTDEDDIDGLAGEYVLGSLSLAERGEVDARRKSDRALNNAVAAWERRLAALGDWVPGIEPPAHMLEAITQRIWGEQAHPARSAAVLLLRRSVRRWRAAAMGAGALAALLAALLVWGLQSLPSNPTALVAVLQKSATGYTADESAEAKSLPGFVVTIDLEQRNILVTPVAARPVARRSYQLWLFAQNGASPVSLAILPPQGLTVLPWQASYRGSADRGASLAISLEPEGGSPTGAPSGPILFVGKLYPVGSL